MTNLKTGVFYMDMTEILLSDDVEVTSRLDKTIATNVRKIHIDGNSKFLENTTKKIK